MSTRDLGTYEMLWDCEACGTKGLLGKSHRHCPACGSPQDAERRYFPAPGTETAVANHQYDGADKTCPACSTPMGARASNCANCGSALDGAAEVARRPDRSDGDFPSEQRRVAATPAARRGRGCAIAVAAVVVATIVFGAVALLWKRDVQVTVAAVRWERAIDVERLDPVRESAWCDSTPRDAYSVSRSREVRDHRKIPDGEECRTKSVDQGDGTFKRVEECRPKYRSEPIYDDKCSYLVDRWRVQRTDTARGDRAQPQQWPSVPLARPGACRGCEREGARRERLLVDLTGVDAAAYTCDVAAPLWARLAPGARVPMKVRVVGGGADCSSLDAAP